MTNAGVLNVSQKITYAKMSQVKREFVDWLIRNMGVAPEALDIDPNGKKGEISFDEAAAYALKNLDWHTYIDRLVRVDPKKYGHPYDDRHYPNAIRQRINEFKLEAFQHALDRALFPGDTNYCGTVFNKFFELGAATFAKGGLCLVYHYEGGYTYDLINVGVTRQELSSRQFFENCMAPSSPGTYMGSCTENAYAKISPFQNDPYCRPNFMFTEGHAYPAVALHDGKYKSLDGSNIGEIGWAKNINPAAVFYYERDFHKIASLIEPLIFPDYSEIKKLFQKYLGYLGTDTVNFVSTPRNEELAKETLDKMLPLFDQVILNNDKTNDPFLYLSGYATNLAPKDAIDFGLAILKRWPNDPYAILPLSAGVKQNDDENIALRTKRLRTNFPASGWAETFEAFSLQNKGRQNEANEKFAEALSLNGRNPYALNPLALAHLLKGDFTTAEKMLKEAMSIAPNLSGNHYLLAQIAQAKGDIDAAYVEAKKESTVFIGNIAANLLHADMATVIGRPNESIKILSQVLNNIPKDYALLPNIYASLVNAYLLKGNVEMAGDVYRAMKRIPNVNKEVLSNTGMMISFAKSDIDGLERYLNRIPKGTWPTQLNRAWALLLKNDIGSAKKISEDLQTKIPNVHDLFRLQAGLAFTMEKVELAKSIYTNISLINKYDFNAMSGVILCDIITGDIKVARKNLAKLDKDFPDVFSIKVLRPLLLLREGKYNEARFEALRILGRNPWEINSSTVLAVAFLKLGGLKNAIKVGRVLNYLNPYNSSGNIIMAEASLELKKYKAAEIFAKRAIKQAGDTPTLWPLRDPKLILEDIAKKKSETR